MLKHKILFTLFIFSSFTFSVFSQELSVYSRLFKVEYYEDDKEITKKAFKEKIMGYDESSVYWKKSNVNEAWFYGTYALALGGAVWTSYEANQVDGNVGTPVAIGLGALIASMIFIDGANKNGAKAILTYNKQFDKKETGYRLVPISNSNGLGLALRF